MNPIPDWLRNYRASWLAGDAVAGLIVTVMLIPQSLAYALLAGLPAEVGLYASLLPIVAYALLGSSMTLAVGPVAVASLMTASALQPLAAAGSVQYVQLAVLLSLLSGVMLLAFGLLRLGFLAHFLSHPVISGFITGSAVLIAVGQLKHLLGVKVQGENVFQTLSSLAHALPQTKPAVLALGGGSVLFLWFARKYLAKVLVRTGLSAKAADMAAKLSPMLVVIVSTAVVSLWGLDRSHGVPVVGTVPQGLPALGLPAWDRGSVQALWLPALLISLVGFVESVSVAQSLALKRQQRIEPNRELLGLGAANVASAVSGGFPVTGGFARSVVNFAAGANTPLAGVISAALMALVVAFFTGWFHALPQAVLAATIIVAVTGLIDWDTLREAWHYLRQGRCAVADRHRVGGDGAGCGGRHSAGGGVVAGHPGVAQQPSAHGCGGPGAGYRALPQRRPAPSRYRARLGGGAGGRKPVFRQRQRAARPYRGAGPRQPRRAPCAAGVLCRQPDRRHGPGGAG